MFHDSSSDSDSAEESYFLYREATEEEPEGFPSHSQAAAGLSNMDADVCPYSEEPIAYGGWCVSKLNKPFGNDEASFDYRLLPFYDNNTTFVVNNKTFYYKKIVWQQSNIYSMATHRIWQQSFSFGNNILFGNNISFGNDIWFGNNPMTQIGRLSNLLPRLLNWRAFLFARLW